jgi:hypothetical protein
MASTSVLSRSFRTLKYLAAPFRWLFGSRWRVLTAATVLAAMIVTPPLWWATQLFGLPDIGDPFDVRAFQSLTIPDERNAFVLYRQAADRLMPVVIPVTTSKEELARIDVHATWSKADPIVRRWVLDSDQIRALAGAWQFWRRDRERSRRVIRLAVANWLAYYDMPPNRRPAPDSQVSSPFDFYSFGPDAPATARALAPEALDRWLNTTYDAFEILRSWDLRKLQAREQANHRALLILLATELYRRDHKSEPPSGEARVGPYLERLSDGRDRRARPR